MTDEHTEPANETDASSELVASEPSPEEPDESKSAPKDRDTDGPFDLTEVRGMRPYVDLGGIKIAPREGLQMRLEVDERTKRVVAVTLELAGSVLQLQAFSAPKSTGLWHRVRGEIKQQLGAQGAQAEEAVGVFGPELEVITPLTADQGGGTRTVRFLGVDGPRWLLRGVIMGRAIDDLDARDQINRVFRETVVVRGEQPMPPSELLPLQMPAGVQPGGAQSGPEQA